MQSTVFSSKKVLNNILDYCCTLREKKSHNLHTNYCQITSNKLLMRNITRRETISKTLIVVLGYIYVGDLNRFE